MRVDLVLQHLQFALCQQLIFLQVLIFLFQQQLFQPVAFLHGLDVLRDRMRHIFQCLTQLGDFQTAAGNILEVILPLPDLLDVTQDLFQRAAEHMVDRTVIIDKPKDDQDKRDDETDPCQVLQHLHRISVIAHRCSDQAVIIARSIGDQIAGNDEHVIVGAVFS